MSLLFLDALGLSDTMDPTVAPPTHLYREDSESQSDSQNTYDDDEDESTIESSSWSQSFVDEHRSRDNSDEGSSGKQKLQKARPPTKELRDGAASTTPLSSTRNGALGVLRKALMPSRKTTSEADDALIAVSKNKTEKKTFKKLLRFRKRTGPAASTTKARARDRESTANRRFDHRMKVRVEVWKPKKNTVAARGDGDSNGTKSQTDLSRGTKTEKEKIVVIDINEQDAVGFDHRGREATTIEQLISSIDPSDHRERVFSGTNEYEVVTPPRSSRV